MRVNSVRAIAIALCLALFAGIGLATTPLAEAQAADDVVITEFLASNGAIDPFGNGEFEDWVELHNTTNSSINLGGWVISDSGNDGVIPAGVTIPANGYRVFLLSGDPTLTNGDAIHLDLRLSAACLLYTSPSPRDATLSRMPSSA